MIDEICCGVYKRLRQRAGLTQKELAPILGISRMTMNKVESGKARLDRAQERKLMDLAKCSKEEFAELVCKQLSELIDKPVGIQDRDGRYEPTTALVRACTLLREQAARIPAAMMRALNNKIHTTRLLGIAIERNNADLVELTQDCLENL